MDLQRQVVERGAQLAIGRVILHEQIFDLDQRLARLERETFARRIERLVEGTLEHLQQIATRGWNLTELVRQEHQRQAANQVSIGNVITSMRLIASLDWITFFEETNHAEQVLRQDPAGVYPRMHFTSRDQYRHVVEELAKRTKRSDVEIAQTAIDCAHAATLANDDVARRGHVGYCLVDAGRHQLELQVGYRPPLHRSLRHKMLRWPHLTYFGLLGLFTLLGGAAIVGICIAASAPAVIETILVPLCAGRCKSRDLAAVGATRH